MKNLVGKLIARRFSAGKSVVDTKLLRSFGEGEIPQSLLYDHPFKLTVLDNGITVATNHMQSNLSTVSVFIKCGSRNQTAESSGTAHFLQHLQFKGTSKRTRINLQLEVEKIGGNLNAYTSREITCYMMSVFNRHLPQAVDILGDMLTNSLYRAPDVENERSTIYRELLQTQKVGPMETNIQMAHRGAYKQHQMGLPILGSIGNMRTISREMILDYHRTNYTGENIIIVGCGPIDHNQLIQHISKHFKVRKSSGKLQLAAQSTPTFNPGMAGAESDLTDKVNTVVMFKASSYFDIDFFTYLLMQRIVGDQPQTQGELLALKEMPSERFQNLLTKRGCIQGQKGFFTSYKDTGLFGTYFLCDPDKLQDAIKTVLQGYNMYAHKLTEQQLMKAKRRSYIQILQHQSQNDISQSLGNNLVYYDRRVCRKQVAERISCVTIEDVRKSFAKLKPQDMQVTIWGNINEVQLPNQKIVSLE